jgi:hypothetical protein
MSRVGDVSAGDVSLPNFPPSSYELTVANGDRLIGTLACSAPLLRTDGIVIVGLCGISAGTGRFEGAESLAEMRLADGTDLDFFFRTVSTDQLIVNIALTAPRLGSQNFVFSGVVSSVTTISADATCRSGNSYRIEFDGPLPQLGRTTGTVSGCFAVPRP